MSTETGRQTGAGSGTEANTGSRITTIVGTERTSAERLERLLALPLILLVKAYQLFFSPMFPPSCRFYPSCSAYAVTALERFGPLKGTWLTVRRLLRCHPWNPGGVDHVPQKACAHGPSASRPAH